MGCRMNWRVDSICCDLLMNGFSSRTWLANSVSCSSVAVSDRSARISAGMPFRFLANLSHPSVDHPVDTVDICIDFV